MTVSVRRCENDADLRRATDIYNAVWPRRAVTFEYAEAWRRSALAAVECIAAVDETDAGSAAAAIHSQRPSACFALITVLHEQRRRGAGDALYAVVSAWAAALGVNEIDTYVEDDDAQSLAFALRRSFHEHARESGLELDVRSARVDLQSPLGVAVYSLAERPELADGTWDVAAEAIPDIPGDEDWIPPPRERWVDEFLLGPSTPPAALFVAVANGEVIGYAKLSIAPDRRSAWHGMTAVKAAWRGRGVATALKSAQIAWAQASAIDRLTTTNELRNEPMRRLNERLGYRPAPGRVQLRGPLAS